ncbi:AraC-like DNA-binding protein [Paenibacillus anaericanus]|uniref:helix-turn-helix transcriptional regulator n=1 Tax=Paenibacillus anaericanus TaxID=170367 RepID=UPI00278969BD|nr:helix-turn-helix domain-containing protein [Paenibacillus anaericanus]MDQ0091137.1 AraC-like DNA-binding protein [Paenibacillus anaericanus]
MSAVPFFEIEQIKRTGQFNMDSDHFHETYEIYYLLAGERYYYINNRIYALQVGDLLFINKNQLHRTTSKGTSNHERILINFDDLFIQSVVEMGVNRLPLFQGESFLLRPSVHEQGRIVDLLYMMLREQQEDSLWSTPYLQALLLQLLIILGRIREEKPEPVLPEDNETQRRVYGIIEYLNTYFAEKLTLEGIAEYFFISATYLCRIFKKTTGFTVIEYINYVRIREAQALLRDTNWKVTKIAEQTGFDSIAHFGRVFKQITKRSPLQYRKQNRPE